MDEDVGVPTDAGSLPYGGRGARARPKLVSRGSTRRGSDAATRFQPTPAQRRWSLGWWRATTARWCVEYRHRAVSPAGERIDFPALARYEVRDGKLTRAQMFHFDTAALTGFLDRAQAHQVHRGRHPGLASMTPRASSACSRSFTPRSPAPRTSA